MNTLEDIRAVQNLFIKKSSDGIVVRYLTEKFYRLCPNGYLSDLRMYLQEHV